jgi:pyruvate dehydrogenase E2 component (dihydrolipoamide acetyltransferase)
VIEFRLPSLGADMDEGKLLEWRVRPGDRVERGAIVAVIETPKAAVEVEIWDGGTVQQLVVKPGETVPVGTVLARLLSPGEAPGAMPQKRISPAARRRAEELGVDIGRISGTGPEGAVTVDDVERGSKKEGTIAATPANRAAEMRRAIAAAMSRSKREIPHYYLSETIPMRRAVEWLQAENARRPIAERVLMAALQLKAVALACKACPEMNGHYGREGFRPAAEVHVGVAIALRQGGLIAPAIHDVPGRSLLEVMKALSDLVKRARAGSLRASELTDPTITVTNLGDLGVESAFGVIYPPQVALVGFGRIAERPAVEHGALRAAPAVTASLSADHRASDGHRGALFLTEIARLLQEPEKL